MQFNETSLDKYFFDSQLPELIHALKDIAESLKCSKTPAVRLPVEVSPDYLTEFYYGNLEPSKKIDSETIRQMTRAAVVVQEKLKSRLSEEDWELVTELNTVIDNRACEESAISFQTGFCIAMQMLAAGLSETEISDRKTAGVSEQEAEA